MSDAILVDGDKALFIPNFGAAMVVVRPGNLTGSGPATIKGKKMCVVGDEKAKKTKTGGKPVLLKGGSFSAKFSVQTPAQQPPPGPGAPIPDSTPQYSGKGMFVAANQSIKAC